VPHSKNSSQNKQSRRLEAIKMFHPTQTARRPPKAPKNAVFSLVTLTFDPDRQIRPCEGPNTPSL